MGLVGHVALNLGIAPLAAHEGKSKRDRAISVKEAKTGGLDEDGPATAWLNQRKGATAFLLLSVNYRGLTGFPKRQFTAACPHSKQERHLIGLLHSAL